MEEDMPGAQGRSSWLSDLVLEAGGEKALSLLVQRVETGEALRPHNPLTRSVDVQQQRQHSTDAFEAVPAARKPCIRGWFSASSSCSKLAGCKTVPTSPVPEQVINICKCQESESTKLNSAGAVAVAVEGNNKGAEADHVERNERQVPAYRVTEFEDLALDAVLLDNLRLLGFRIPSPVQCALVPRALDGRNLVVQAKSGTGKTLAFAVYLLQAVIERYKQRLAHLSASSRPAPPGAPPLRPDTAANGDAKGVCAYTARCAHATGKERLSQDSNSSSLLTSLAAAADADCIAVALVITPTRELTIQVANEISRLAWRMRQPRLRHACFFGGRPLSICHQQLAQQPHVLVSTPGRLLSVLRSKETTKVVAEWPCSCARVADFHPAERRQVLRRSSAEEQQPLGDSRNTGGFVSCGNTCEASSNPEKVDVAGGEETRNGETSPGLSNHCSESFFEVCAAPAARCGESSSFGARLRQRLCILVLDEADMLLGHLFRRQTKKLLTTILHPRLQIVATSATFPPPCIAFLEELYDSLNDEEQRGPFQHTEVHVLPPCNAEGSADSSQGTSQDVANFADAAATLTRSSSVAAATFIRDLASATGGADVRREALEAYISNFTARSESGSSASRCEMTKCHQGRTDCRTSSGAVGYCGAKASQDAANMRMSPTMRKIAGQVVDGFMIPPRPRGRENAQSFERVLLCTSFIVHSAERGFTICEASARGPRHASPETATASLTSACTTQAESHGALRKPDSWRISVPQNSLAFCGLPNHNKSEGGGPGDKGRNQLNRSLRKELCDLAVRSFTGDLLEKNSTSRDLQGNVYNFESVGDDGRPCSNCLPGEVVLDEVSRADLDGACSKAANALYPLEITAKLSDTMKILTPGTDALSPTQGSCLQPTEEQKAVEVQESAESIVNGAPPMEKHDRQGGEIRGVTHPGKPYRRRIEPPSLIGIHYVIMTVEDEPSPMRQLGAKVRVLQHIFANVEFRQAMIFCNQAEAGAQVAACLIQLGVPTLYTSSKLTQEHRVRNLLALKRIDCRVFVCSDVMSRGIDAAAVDLVINLDVPRDKDIFLHRSGRAGRFGGRGVCVCIASSGEQPFFEYIITALKLPVFRSLESLLALRERVKQQDGAGQAFAGVDNKDGVPNSNSDSKAELQDTGKNVMWHEGCTVPRPSAACAPGGGTEDGYFELVKARKDVLVHNPVDGTSAAELYAAADVVSRETGEADTGRDRAAEAVKAVSQEFHGVSADCKPENALPVLEADTTSTTQLTSIPSMLSALPAAPHTAQGHRRQESCKDRPEVERCHMAAFNRESVASGECIESWYAEDAAAYRDHPPMQSNPGGDVVRSRRVQFDFLRSPGRRYNAAAPVAYALLRVKQNHALFWEYL